MDNFAKEYYKLMKDRINDYAITETVLQGLIKELDVKQKFELSTYIMEKYK